MFAKTIDFLLENACVNIRYLIQRDILEVRIDEPEMKSMQDEILKSPVVQKCLSAQISDGWLGQELHGGDGADSLMAVLLRSGVEAGNSCIQNAVNALVTTEIARQHKNNFAAGDALDADDRGGIKSITAWIVSTMGFPEDKQPLAEEIQLSFDHLAAALSYKNVDEFTIQGTKFRYYKPSAFSTLVGVFSR